VTGGGQKRYDLNIIPAREAFMKRYLLSIPILLFTFLNACNGSSEISPAVHTAVVQTMTAAVITPTITPTPMYVTERYEIDEYLNTAIKNSEVLTKFDQLEYAIGAHYRVTDVKFLSGNGDTTNPTTFEVDISCECPTNIDCCTRERAFVIAMIAMNAYQGYIIERVPYSVDTFRVRCSDHNDPNGGISASWYSVTNFLADPTNGYRLQSQVTYEP
jgi:hypothetical protein